MRKGLQKDTARVLFASTKWGTTLTGLAATEDPESLNLGPFKGYNFKTVEYNNIKALQDRLEKKQDIAGFVIEPISTQDGVRLPDPEYIKKVRQLCSKHEVALIFDELVSGLGRTGKFCSGDWYGVKPDMLVLGRSLGGAHYPVSAILCSDEVASLIK